jgi:hypothetical protein
MAKTPDENARYFSEYFSAVFNPTVNTAGLDLIKRMRQRECKRTWGEPTSEELRKAISMLRDTAAGPTGLPCCVWQTLGKCEKTFQIILAVMQGC